MNNRILLLAITLLIFSACNQAPPLPNTLIGTDKLKANYISIDINKANILRTAGGAIINIPAHAIESDTDQVQLKIIEAYTVEDMIRGGLTTKTNGIPLSSDGMIYIDVVQQNKIRRPIKVYLPTKQQREGMEVFKGFVDQTGAINWNDPKPVSDTPLQKLVTGRQLFRKNCASCHHPIKDATGPALGIVAVNRDKDWLYKFTRNPNAMIADGDPYANYIFCQWHMTSMTAFPDLSDDELDLLYGYLKSEAYKAGINTLKDDKDCFDSCMAYLQVRQLRDKRNALINSNDGNSVTYIDPTSSGVMQQGIVNVTPMPEDSNRVVPSGSDPRYYQFTIDAWGWYNIDIVTKGLPGFEPSELTVRISGTYDYQMHVYLVVPDQKMFVDGGLMRDSKDTYAFFTDDGKINLPIGQTAYILAMGELGDSIVLGQTSVTITAQNNLELTMKQVTKTEFNNALSIFRKDGLNMKANDSKNADAIRQTDKQIDAAEAMKPVNCDCSCISNTSQVIPVQEELLSGHRRGETKQFFETTLVNIMQNGIMLVIFGVIPVPFG